ncbi:MAG TPA: hypothetical protein VMV69_04880 [Pirellulales bacterium]|nr:hypothetical protein [Pirellulales bacterium]
MKYCRFVYLAAIATPLALIVGACNREAPAPTPSAGAPHAGPSSADAPLGEPARTVRKPLQVDVHVGGQRGVNVDVEGRRTEPGDNVVTP